MEAINSCILRILMILIDTQKYGTYNAD